MFKKWAFVLFSLRGRITRSQFWWSLIPVLLFGYMSRDAQANLPTLIGGVAFIYLSITVYGKRLHDFGKSALLLLLPYGIHAAALLVAGYYTQQLLYNPFDYSMVGTITAISVAPLVFWLGFALYTGIPRGHDGDNRFGTDPKAQELPAATPGSEAA